MSNLNPSQFKIDLGMYHNVAYDQTENNKRIRADYRGEQPETRQAPDGYYAQPSSKIRQQALPGMEMSVQDHLDALGKATGTRASIESGRVSHRIALHEPSEHHGVHYTYGVERAHLSYNHERSEAGERDSGDTVGSGIEAKHPGEIRMVKSNVPGAAGKMLETAERLANEHGMAYPKHSWDRTTPGVRWSQKQMKRRGEQVW